MTEFISETELNRIRLALNIEIKNHYIDIEGRECPFSVFMKREINKLSKRLGKSPKWEALSKDFEYYGQEGYGYRKLCIERFIKLLKFETEIAKEEQSNKNRKYSEDIDIYTKDVTYLRGVGPKISQLFNKLGIYTVYDLLTYYPKKYIDYSKRILIRDLTEDTDATIFCTVSKVKTFTSKKKLTVMTVTVADESGSLDLTFFYASINRFLIEHYKSNFKVGTRMLISGKVKLDGYSHRLTLSKTEYQTVDGDFYDSDNLNVGRIVPVYALCENLNIKTLRRAISNALEDWSKSAEEFIPEYIREKYKILPKEQSLKMIHFPKNFEEADNARNSLVFEELFLLELKMGIIKQEHVKNTSSTHLTVAENGLVRRFVSGLPFELTSAQKRAINEIFGDIDSGKPMQRLLQGDVGSGKTVVACTMLLAAVENGYQAAIMAPTEILAAQHFNNFVSLLTPLGVNVALFTSSNSAKQKKLLETNLLNGQIDIAVGTHALIQNKVEFKNLGAVIIDEQHRFGVKQRNALKSKATVPQMLTMSATPIPRTLALTAHGDLDLTVIDELPAGRKEIKTTLIKLSEHKKAYNLIKSEIDSGHQAYIVFPLIEESETISAKAATKEAEVLQNGIFKDYRVGLLHGKMSAEEKDDVMNDFKSKKYDILVSTTVIEVGVDVPNATVIMIENAERFGLSQLHQLRGRVGRNSLQSYCILVSSSNSQDTLARLNIMTQTNDGFVIAEKDLEIRGPGEFLGIRQSGMPELNLTDLTRDLKILEIARKSAFDFLNTNNINDFPALKKYIGQNLKITKDTGIPD